MVPREFIGAVGITPRHPPTPGCTARYDPAAPSSTTALTTKTTTPNHTALRRELRFPIPAMY
jgi:hypothetical protein